MWLHTIHVDAACGGPALFSADVAPMMKGIERADSVTPDGHKQLFMPLGCGLLLLEAPTIWLEGWRHEVHEPRAPGTGFKVLDVVDFVVCSHYGVRVLLEVLRVRRISLCEG